MKNNDNKINLSDNAAKRIKYLIDQSNLANAKLRISVEGGGCSGFFYKYNITDKEVSIDDIVIIKDGAILLIDEISIGFMKDCTIDYVESMTGSYFDIINPAASSRCGCGNSFATK